MAKPATTISHFHVCPKVTAKVPHVGGPVVQGSPNVTIGGLPAARVGDTLICVGPPDKIKRALHPSSSMVRKPPVWATAPTTVV